MGGVFMVFNKAKLFSKTEAGREKICTISYDEKEEYYTFLKRAKNEGYRQIIVTSDIMVTIIRTMCLEKGFSVYKIELAEEDFEIEQEIDALIDESQQDRILFCNLLQKIEFLAEQSSIDFARVYIKGKFANGFTPNMFIQANGIMGVNVESFEEITKIISNVVEGCLFE